MGGFLGRAVALEGRRGEVLAVHAPDAGAAEPPPPSAQYARGSPAPRALRVALPAAAAAGRRRDRHRRLRGRRGRRLGAGRLLLLGDRPASDAGAGRGRRASAACWPWSWRGPRPSGVPQDAARRAESLPADGPPWVMLVARQVRRSADRAPSIEAARRFARDSACIAPPRRLALRGDAESLELRLVLAVRRRRPAEARAAGRRLRRRTFWRLDRRGWPTCSTAGRRLTALRGPGRPARRRGRGTGHPGGRSRRCREPPRSRAGGPAARLPAARRRCRTCPTGSARPGRSSTRCSTGSAEARRERLATLRAVLEQPGLREAAAALGVHRNTLAYRVRRIESLTGWRLADPDLRLPARGRRQACAI